MPNCKGQRHPCIYASCRKAAWVCDRQVQFFINLDKQ